MTNLQKRERSKLQNDRKVLYGDPLRAARLDKDLGTRLLASMSGISLCTIRQIENGRQEPTIATLKILVETLDQA